MEIYLELKNKVKKFKFVLFSLFQTYMTLFILWNPKEDTLKNVGFGVFWNFFFIFLDELSL